MTQVLRTVNLNITKNTVKSFELIRATAVEFGKVYDFYASVACNLKSCNANLIHNKGYKESVEEFPLLGSALNQAARNSACANVMAYNARVPQMNKLIAFKNSKNEKRCSRFNKQFTPKPLAEEWKFPGHHKGLSYHLNARSFSIIKNDEDTMISIGTIKSRIRIPLNIPEWFDSRYPNKRVFSAAISINEKTKGVTLHVTYSIQDENSKDVTFYESKKPNIDELSEENVIGVDRGIYHPVATSNGILISSKPYYAVQRRYVHNVNSLKLKSTSSSRKRLRSQRRKRKLFNNDMTHCLSKRIANIPGVKVVVFENLTNSTINMMINDEKDHMTKKTKAKRRRWLHSWNFAELESKTLYKCNMKGIYVRHVSPYNTSRACSNCHRVSLSSRYKNWYRCPLCGHTEHADINAAKNIRDRYLGNLRNMPQGAFNHP